MFNENKEPLGCFEIVLSNGKNDSFNTGAELCEWYDRNSTKKGGKRKHKKKPTNKNILQRKKKAMESLNVSKTTE